MRLVDSRGNPLRRAADGPARRVSARYDAAQLSEETRKHWSESDHLSARSANSLEVRRRLRERSRYETANNSYASGMVDTLANDLIGDGPKLQLTGPDQGANREIEAAFCDWADSVDLAEKLRIMRRARAVDGEAFLFLESDPDLSPVQLDLRLFECDCVMTPFPYPLDPLRVDGIVFNTRMKPIEYHLLRTHPGDMLAYGYMFEFDPVPARYVIHWFKPSRPQQYRGIPDLTPALNLFAQLRRYTLAVLAAAETAADFAALLESQLPPDADTLEAEPFETLEIEKRMMTTLPAGYKLSQFRAEQPTTTYEMFKREILNEVARSLNIPYNIAAGNSSSYNYSSGQLDHKVYYRSLKVDRAQLECVALNRIFAAWLEEASMATDLIPPGTDLSRGIPHRWLWPGQEHADPEKEANAQEIRLRTLSSTFSDECYQQGVDPQDRLATIASDIAAFNALGIPSPYGAKATAAPSGAANQPGGDGAQANGHHNGVLPWQR